MPFQFQGHFQNLYSSVSGQARFGRAPAQISIIKRTPESLKRAMRLKKTVPAPEISKVEDLKKTDPQKNLLGTLFIVLVDIICISTDN